ncbi:unnamed protein product [Rotaria sordida]|uniref:NADAR domain-containing protein n=1 Tax=Rotaria sordida TaxID=392033 RepID=A0A814B476_9BILA|nr:unnamed protein product [Rotaria sordida]CAF0932352.1 unnamed protein product [Rotaria sordida]
MAAKQAYSTSSILTSSENELIQRVHSHFPNNEPNKFHFFYRTASPFSNFHPCSFSENEIQFHTTEQYMMYHKAKLFNDNETAEGILQATTPADCKALGRIVKNFDEQLWMDNRTRILSNGIYLKFTENDQLKQVLLKQYGSLLVEAAANDGIWGVGLKQDNPLIEKRSNWKGLNLLGYILTDTLHRIYDQN